MKQPTTERELLAARRQALIDNHEREARQLAERVRVARAAAAEAETALRERQAVADDRQREASSESSRFDAQRWDVEQRLAAMQPAAIVTARAELVLLRERAMRSHVVLLKARPIGTWNNMPHVDAALGRLDELARELEALVFSVGSEGELQRQAEALTAKARAAVDGIPSEEAA